MKIRCFGSSFFPNSSANGDEVCDVEHDHVCLADIGVTLLILLPLSRCCALCPSLLVAVGSSPLPPFCALRPLLVGVGSSGGHHPPAGVVGGLNLFYPAQQP